MHPLDLLFVKIPLNDVFTQNKILNDVVKSEGEDEINDDSKSELSGVFM